jgi:hypothetical protein
MVIGWLKPPLVAVQILFSTANASNISQSGVTACKRCLLGQVDLTYCKECVGGVKGKCCADCRVWAEADLKPVILAHILVWEFGAIKNLEFAASIR